MTPHRMHRTTSADGTVIVGGVHGSGPPLVLVPGGPADGERGWLSLLPHLVDHVTCYTINTRGRGPSGDHPDHARERIVEDIVAFVESIGDEVALFGHSAGGTHALEAAAHTASVSTLALYEPTLTDLGDERLRARFRDAFVRVRRAVDAGRPEDAAWIFLDELAMVNDTERALLEQVGAAQAMAPLVPVVLAEEAASGPPQLSDLSLLDRITMPVVLLHGARTDPFYTDVVGQLTMRLADVRTSEIPDVGHLGPEIEPGPVAAELVRQLHAASQPA